VCWRPAGSPNRQACRQRLGDGTGNLVLHREDVGQLAIVALRPEVAAVGGGDQLRGDPDPIAALRTLLRARARRRASILTLERNAEVRAITSVRYLRQRVDDLFGQPALK
jgi:hypothetical protein